MNKIEKVAVYGAIAYGVYWVYMNTGMGNISNKVNQANSPSAMDNNARNNPLVQFYSGLRNYFGGAPK